MTTNELKKFWSTRPVKIWVVSLEGVGRNKKTDSKIVRAKTIEGALFCAKNNSMLFHNKKCSGFARYADPVFDLHCVKT